MSLQILVFAAEAMLGLGWGSRIGAELSTERCWAAVEERDV